jgi:hypothetical protein
MLARTISILGHPAMMIPAAILMATARRGLTWGALAPLLIALALAAGLMLWSARQVRRGKWRHIDASAPAERSGLNRVTLAVLASAALLAAGAHAVRLSVGLTSGAIVPALAVVAGSRFKLSQHVAFATLSVFIAGYAGSSAALAMGALTPVIAWSRFRLGRHSAGELVAGAVVGAVAGALLVFGLHHTG